MPFNGSGGFTRAMNWTNDATAGIKILASRHDTEDNGFATGLSNVICKDGQTSITADIPFNAKKITGLANPINPQDAATKAYVDAIRTFSTGIVLSGAGVNSIISYTAADLSYLTRSVDTPAAGWQARFVWNDKADGTGTDIMSLTDGSVLSFSGAASIGFNSRYDASGTPAWKAIVAGYGGQISLDPANGVLNLKATQTSVLASGVLSTLGAALTLYPDGTSRFSGTVVFSATVSGDAMFITSNATNRILSFGPSAVLRMDVASGDYVLASATGNRFWSNNATGIFALPTYLNWNCGASSSSQYAMYISAGDALATFGASKYIAWSASGNWQLFDTGGVRITCRNSDGAFIIPTNGYKPGGGVWADSSDARIKNVLGDFEGGLAEIRLLNPVRYTFKGNETNEPPTNDVDLSALEEDRAKLAKENPVAPYPNSPHYQIAQQGKEFVGMIAQDVELVLPQAVTRRPGFIDGEATEILDLDTSSLAFAFINAIKELADRVEALETAA